MTEVRIATWLQDMALAYPTELISILPDLSDDIADVREPEHQYLANS